MTNKGKIQRGFFSSIIGIVKVLIGVLIIGMLFLFMPTSTDKFAEFHITNLSKPITLIDSVSAPHQKYNSFILIKIRGEIDSSASISYGANDAILNNGDKKIQIHTSFPLTKGKINIDVRHDYYSGDTVHLFFMPKGSKKGWLKIETQIN